MNRKHFKAILVLAGLMLLNLIAAAQGASEKFSNFVNADESDFTGVYIILGIVVASLVTYLVVNHYSKEEESAPRRNIHPHHRRHHHHHRVIKKTH